MNNFFFLLLTMLLLCANCPNLNAQACMRAVTEPLTFESYNRMQLIFKGYPIAATNIDEHTVKITYQVTKMFKGDESIKQVALLVVRDYIHPDWQEQQLGETYTQLMSCSFGMGSEQLRAGLLLIGCENDDLNCIENYTPRCDRREQAKFILDNGHKTGYAKNYYKKIKRVDVKMQLIEWEPLGLEAEGNLKNGQAHGLWKYYDKNGKLIRETIYQNGLEVGDIYHSEDGNDLSFGNQKIKYTYSFNNNNNLIRYSKKEYKPDNGSLSFLGYLSSESEEYYSNGGLKISYKWHEDKNTLEKKEYYENGILKEEGQIQTSEKIGLWNYYDENGNLTKTENHPKK